MTINIPNVIMFLMTAIFAYITFQPKGIKATMAYIALLLALLLVYI